MSLDKVYFVDDNLDEETNAERFNEVVNEHRSLSVFRGHVDNLCPWLFVILWRPSRTLDLES